MTGISILLLVVIYSSIATWRYVFFILVGIISSPFLLYNGFLWALSPFYVLAVRKSDEPASGCDRCCLCAKCGSLIEESPLLVGADSVFTRAMESHNFYSVGQLEISAERCHLCNLLWHSTARSKLSPPSSAKLSHDKTPREATHGVTPGEIQNSSVSDTTQWPVKAISHTNFNDNMELEAISASPGAATDCLKVKVWKDRYEVWSFVQLQLCGNFMSDPVPLSISRHLPGTLYVPLYNTSQLMKHRALSTSM